MFPDLQIDALTQRRLEMAGDYILEGETAAAAPRRFDKFLKTFIILAGLGLAGQLIWLMGITPFRPFSRIDISGFDGLTKEEIFAAAGITSSSSYYSTDTRAMEKALTGLYTLQSAKVFRHFPDRLQIVLEGQRAVASALASMGGRSVPVFFNSQGVVYRIGGDENESALSRQLPVISGLFIEDPVPGMRLPAMFLSLFRQLEKIQSSAPELLTAVSELRINPKPYDGFDLVLYPVHRKVKVRIHELNEDLLRYTLLMVDVLASKEPGIESLDFRSGIASYKPLEVSSE